MIDPAAIFSGLGAIVTAAGGVALVLRELRRRDRVALAEEIKELNLEVHELRASFQDFRRFAYQLRMQMVDAGLDPPDPPIPDMGLSRMKEKP
ncbi:MAG TPA: hypothetical protein VJN72_06260 [Gaiellales bacterium]|nr:hypothetical protein [Gaiellales bacterium]